MWLLIDYTKSNNEEDRRLAAYALGKLSHLKPEIPLAVPHLIDLLDDENKKIRLTTLESLGNIGDKKALPYLIILKNKEKDETCLSAIEESVNKIKNK